MSSCSCRCWYDHCRGGVGCSGGVESDGEIGGALDRNGVGAWKIVLVA